MEALRDELRALVALHSSPCHEGKDKDHRQTSATFCDDPDPVSPQHPRASTLQTFITAETVSVDICNRGYAPDPPTTWEKLFRLVSVVNGEECARLRKVIDRHLQCLAKLKARSLISSRQAQPLESRTRLRGLCQVRNLHMSILRSFARLFRCHWHRAVSCLLLLRPSALHRRRVYGEGEGSDRHPGRSGCCKQMHHAFMQKSWQRKIEPG